MKHKAKGPAFFNPYLGSLILVACVTALGECVKRNLEPTNLVMLYLLAVVFVALKWGRSAAILTSLLSVLAFDFFLVPPYYTFTVGDAQYGFTGIGFLTVGWIISELIFKTRDQERKVKKLELLEATEKLQSALLNSISHDLRTPLVSITGTLSMLFHDASWLDEETKKELVGNAFEQSGRMNRLVGNLLDMTRVEAGALKVFLKPCDLSDVIGVSLEELSDKLKDRPVDIQIPENFPEIPMDFALMTKVLVNLIDNAIKYSPEQSPVEIHAMALKDEVRIEIADRGMGIPESDLKRIFSKFYRTERSHQKRGIGLGLSIAKGIVEAHGGKIWAENRKEQKGASFVLMMPLREKP